MIDHHNAWSSHWQLIVCYQIICYIEIDDSRWIVYRGFYDKFKALDEVSDDVTADTVYKGCWGIPKDSVNELLQYQNLKADLSYYYRKQPKETGRKKNKRKRRRKNNKKDDKSPESKRRKVQHGDKVYVEKSPKEKVAKDNNKSSDDDDENKCQVLKLNDYEKFDNDDDSDKGFSEYVHGIDQIMDYHIDDNWSKNHNVKKKTDDVKDDSMDYNWSNNHNIKKNGNNVINDILLEAESDIEIIDYKLTKKQKNKSDTKSKEINLLQGIKATVCNTMSFSKYANNSIHNVTNKCL